MSRRFQFSLRTFLLALTTLAIPLSWVSHNANLCGQRTEVRRLLNSGERGFELAFVHDGTIPIEVPWIRRIMGDWPAAGFCWDRDADKDRAFLERMHRIFPEAMIIGRELWQWMPTSHFDRWVQITPRTRGF
jgi:hypothetical protein